jgi:hypothetical protein
MDAGGRGGPHETVALRRSVRGLVNWAKRFKRRTDVFHHCRILAARKFCVTLWAAVAWNFNSCVVPKICPNFVVMPRHVTGVLNILSKIRNQSQTTLWFYAGSCTKAIWKRVSVPSSSVLYMLQVLYRHCSQIQCHNNLILWKKGIKLTG